MKCCWLSAGDSAEAAQIALRCQELLHQPRAGEQVAGSWGSGAGLVLEETRAAMSRLLKVPLYPPRMASSRQGAAEGVGSDFHQNRLLHSLPMLPRSTMPRMMA